MAYNDLYIARSEKSLGGSILEFFGFRISVNKSTRLHALKHTYIEKDRDEEHYVVKEKTVGFTSEETGFYDGTLERHNTPTGKRLELEERFISSVKMEGKEPYSHDFIWHGPTLCKSVDEYYRRASASVMPTILAWLTGIAAAIYFGYSFYQYYLVRNAGLPDNAESARTALALFGGIAVTFIVWWLASLLFEEKPLNKCSEKRQEEVREEYLQSLGSAFSPETAQILREYAVLMGYDRVSTLRIRSKWVPFVASVLVLAAAVVLWMEVLTVQVYLVTEDSDISLKTVYKYDYKGRITNVATYNSYGDLVIEDEYQYNNMNDLEKSVRYTVQNDEKVATSSIKYVENLFGGISSETHLDEKGQELYKIYYSRNGKNLVQEIAEYDGKVQLNRTTLEYDKRLLVRRVEYKGPKKDETQVAVHEYSYNNDGNITGYKAYQEELLTKEIVYTYDGELLMTETASLYGTDGQLTDTLKREYSYNAEGNLEKITSYSNDQLIKYSLVTCDENGNVAEMVEYTPEDQPTGAVQSYSYQKFRMLASRAKRLRLEWGEERVVIDFGLF